MVRVNTADTTDLAAVETLTVTGAENLASGCRTTDRGHCCRAVGDTVNVFLIRGSQCVASGLKKATNVVEESHTSWRRGAWRWIGWMGWGGEGVSEKGVRPGRGG